MQKLVKYVWFDISFCCIYYKLEKIILEWRGIYFKCFNTIAQCQWNLNLRKGVCHAKNCSFDRIRNLPVNHCSSDTILWDGNPLQQSIWGEVKGTCF